MNNRLVLLVLLFIALINFTQQEKFDNHEEYFKTISHNLKKVDSKKILQLRKQISKFLKNHSKRKTNTLEVDTLFLDAIGNAINDGFNQVKQGVETVGRVVTVTVQEVSKVNWVEEARTQADFFVNPNIPLEEKQQRMVNNMNAGMSPVEFLSNKYPAFETALEMIPLNPWGLVNAIRGRDLQGNELTNRERAAAAFGWAIQPFTMAAEKAADAGKAARKGLTFLNFPGEGRVVNFLSRRLGPKNMRRIATLANLGKTAQKAYETFQAGKDFLENLKNLKTAIEAKDWKAAILAGVKAYSSGKDFGENARDTTGSFRQTRGVDRVLERFEQSSLFQRLNRRFRSPKLKILSDVVRVQLNNLSRIKTIDGLRAYVRMLVATENSKKFRKGGRKGSHESLRNYLFGGRKGGRKGNRKGGRKGNRKGGRKTSFKNLFRKGGRNMLRKGGRKTSLRKGAQSIVEKFFRKGRKVHKKFRNEDEIKKPKNGGREWKIKRKG